MLRFLLPPTAPTVRKNIASRVLRQAAIATPWAFLEDRALAPFQDVRMLMRFYGLCSARTR